MHIGPITRTFAISGGLVVLLPFLVGSQSVSIEILVLALAVLGSNLLLGYTGLMSFAQGGFFGIGAYVAGLLRVHLDAGIALTLLLPTIAGALAAILVGLVAIRRHGIYFVMLTLAFAQLIYFLVFAFPGLTGGENGLQGVARPSVVGFSISSNLSLYILVATLFVVVMCILTHITRSPFGKVLVAIRENEKRAVASGYDARLFKIAAFGISGALAGLAGALQALFLGLASISNVEILMSQEILMMSIIGGAHSLYGAFVGAAFFTIVSNVLSAWWPRWLLILGVLLIALVLYLPGGLAGAARTLFKRGREWRAERSLGAKEVAQ
ncbi:branched-chain amino acid ABC transporter permease [Xenophilus azovorans]|uniref:branched-chain amino acid ABC transporter permease n=1 Tax=Xenophilus azovorans TaxID=151755 RepID=UPI00056DF6BF|nr:branched-chain amino acid ABC transporter permease [Xenophilus azovorans]